MKEDLSPHDIEKLVAEMHALLRGRSPSVQSTMLADLTALYIAGHHPQIRGVVLDMHDRLVRKLIPVNDKQRFGKDGHPGWRQPLSDETVQAFKDAMDEAVRAFKDAVQNV